MKNQTNEWCDFIYAQALINDLDYAIKEYATTAQPDYEIPLLTKLTKAIQQGQNKPDKEIEDILLNASRLAYKESIVKVEEKEAHGNGNNETNNRQLRAVFDVLFESDKGYQYALEPLSFEAVFPKKEVDDNVYADFDRLFDDLNKCDTQTKLYHTLEKYLWCIPSEQIEDISLFDHTKITAALAVCLYYQQKEAKNEKQAGDFILINGDISGIQSFIFNIPSKKASKSLKGRSVYIELLMNVISRKIIKDLGLKPANLMYCGGGNFFILAPSCKIKAFEDSRKEILKILLKAHAGDLYLALDYAEMTEEDLSNYQANVRKVKEKTGALKMKRWSLLGLKDQYGAIFGPLDEGSKEVNVCKICGTSYNVSIQEKEEFPKCGLCRSLWELTDQIKTAQYISFKEVEVPFHQDKFYATYQDIFKALGVEVEFPSDLHKIRESYQKDILMLNNLNFIENNNLDGFFFGSYNLPVNGNEQLTFEDLSKEGVQDDSGDEKLAYLKLDVDNLGAVFGGGLGESKSITRVSYLSRMMKIFFEGYINVLIDNDEQFKNKLYVIFSGGDDTFVVGPWNTVISFYERFHQKFGEYCAFNEHMTFSAGIQIYPPKYPVIRAADQVEEALEEAKKMADESTKKGLPPKKNNMSLFGEVFRRRTHNEPEEKDDFLIIKDIHSILVNAIKETDKRSILQKVMNSTIGFKGILEDITNNRLDIQRYWRLAYYLRDYKKTDRNGLTKDYAEELLKNYKAIVIDNLMSQNQRKELHKLMIIPVAVRWAELETRKIKE